MSSSYIGKVLDNYRIIENLGIGGMGVVYKAIHIKLDKHVAVKMIAPGLTMNKDFIKRFQTEAKALAKLEDPNIIRIYDLRADNDQWFIVMEYIEGINLFEKIKKDGAFRWQVALPIVKQMLTGIGHAHAAGIIHRDIKPNNIMITNDHVVKVTDFGLAKDQGSVVTTIPLSSGGTLYYMSPEHVKGISFTDKRSDIYSIGMTFYEMLAGTVPFKEMESDFDIRETIVRKEISKPSVYSPGIPEILENVVMKSLAKDPDKRYQTTRTMLDSILEFEEKFPVIALGDEILTVPTTKKKNKTEVNNEDGPDTRFKKALRKQNIDFLKGYGIVLSLIFISIIAILIYLFSSNSSNPQKNPSDFAELSIKSTPSNVIVYIDGDSVGTSPLQNYMLLTGSHKIILQKNNYMSIDTLISVKSNSSDNFSFDLIPIPDKTAQAKDIGIHSPAERLTQKKNYTSLYAISMPAGATVWINNKKIGKTPIRVNQLDSKTHKIRIEKNGYTPYHNNIELKSGITTRINATLHRLSGGLQINTNPKDAIIAMDGVTLHDKRTPLVLTDIPLGRHHIEISKSGYTSKTQNINIEKDQVATISIDLLRLNGNLAVQVRPWGSIYLNNELKKASSDITYQVNLPVDEYELQVVHPTLGKWEKNIQIEANNDLKVIVDFNKKYMLKVHAVDESGNALNAQVFIDDKKREGTTPADILVRAGVHRMIVKKDGFIASIGEKEIFVDKISKKNYQFVLKKIE